MKENERVFGVLYVRAMKPLGPTKAHKISLLIVKRSASAFLNKDQRLSRKLSRIIKQIHSSEASKLYLIIEGGPLVRNDGEEMMCFGP